MPSVYIGPEEGREAWEAEQVEREHRAEVEANLRQIAVDAATVNDLLARQTQPIIDYCKAVIAAPTPAIAAVDPADPNLAFALIDHGSKTVDQLTSLTGVIKFLAAHVQTLAEHDRESLSQRTALAQLVAQLYDAG